MRGWDSLQISPRYCEYSAKRSFGEGKSRYYGYDHKPYSSFLSLLSSHSGSNTEYLKTCLKIPEDTRDPRVFLGRKEVCESQRMGQWKSRLIRRRFFWRISAALYLKLSLSKEAASHWFKHLQAVSQGGGWCLWGAADVSRSPPRRGMMSVPVGTHLCLGVLLAGGNFAKVSLAL